AYSYGIADEDSWGCEVSKKLHLTVHEYDCFDTRRPTCDGGSFSFHEECVGAAATSTDGRAFDTVASQIAKNGDRGKHLVVKMDVEGAELESFEATPDEVLRLTDQLVVEFHDVDTGRQLRVIQRLLDFFYVVNVHANNCCCSSLVGPFGGDT